MSASIQPLHTAYTPPRIACLASLTGYPGHYTAHHLHQRFFFKACQVSSRRMCVGPHAFDWSRVLVKHTRPGCGLLEKRRDTVTDGIAIHA